MSQENHQIVHCKRVPAYHLYIGRPAKGGFWGFGNPFVIGPDGDRATVIAHFDTWLETGESFGHVDATDERRQWILSHIEMLRGKTLGCWCNFPEVDCHGRIYLERLDKILPKSDINPYLGGV